MAIVICSTCDMLKILYAVYVPPYSMMVLCKYKEEYSVEQFQLLEVLRVSDNIHPNDLTNDVTEHLS